MSYLYVLYRASVAACMRKSNRTVWRQLCMRHELKGKDRVDPAHERNDLQPIISGIPIIIDWGGAPPI